MLAPLVARAADRAGEDYLAQVTAGLLDDRCHILEPAQKKPMDDYRLKLEAELKAAVPDFPSAATMDEATARAQAADCLRAVAMVRDAHEEAVAAKAAAATAPLTLAMSVGKRCHVATDDENRILLAAWRKRADDVAQSYNARIRLKYVMHEREFERQADAIACSRARQTVNTALAVARNPQAR